MLVAGLSWAENPCKIAYEIKKNSSSADHSRLLEKRPCFGTTYHRRLPLHRARNLCLETQKGQLYASRSFFVRDTVIYGMDGMSTNNLKVVTGTLLWR